MGKWVTRRRIVTTGVASLAAIGVAGGASLVACGTDEAPGALASVDRLDDALLDIRFAKRISAAVNAEFSARAVRTAVETLSLIHI